MEYGKHRTVSQKRFLGVSVLDAARTRIKYIFSRCTRICVAFSGGKDSTAMLHLVMEEAQRLDVKVGVLFIDWEAQYKLTIQHVEHIFNYYKDHIDPYWVSVPLTTTNAVSMMEPEWTCWDPAKKDLWVRQPPAMAITDGSKFPFWYFGTTFEEFVEEFGTWYAQGEPTAQFIGIRTAESLNRWRTIANDYQRLDNLPWTSCKTGYWNAYPIYDWRTEDIWTYFAREQKPYNEIYDRMHQAGLTVHQMRICEPYGDEQRKGLHLYHAIEPETWGRVCARVAGANSGALYSEEKGNILGNQHVSLPEGHTWESFAKMLLTTMPTTTAEHYRDKIAVYLQYFKSRDILVPDSQPKDTGSKDIPSWRRICKVLLKNDYWCKGLSFSPTKTSNYEKYRTIMQRRRAQWDII